MSTTKDNLLELYSPIQVDIIDRDISGQVIPLQAVDSEHAQEYLVRIARAFGELQSQENARSAFVTSAQDWSEVCEKIISVTRSVSMINGRPYGIYSCQSHGELTPEEVDSLKWYCRNQWEQGWGEGYAYCPREELSMGLYIHFWQDNGAPLLTREQLETVHQAEQSRPAVTEITPDTFWITLAQMRDTCGQDQEAAAFWLTERFLTMGPEQTLNFHSIIHGYMELADKHGLWNAAALIQENGCYRDGFEVFRTWLIAQGKDVYLAALKNPDSLADVPVGENSQFESLLYVGDMAYQRLTGRMAYEAVDPDIHQKLLAELRRDIVYGAGIEYPHRRSELDVYLPRLCAAHAASEELRARACQGLPWNKDNSDIPKAQAMSPKKNQQKERW